jgi:hypothetical protein
MIPFVPFLTYCLYTAILSMPTHQGRTCQLHSPGVSAVLVHALRLPARGGAELERADVKGFPIQRADRVRTRAGAYVRGQRQRDLGSVLRTRVYGPDLLAYVQT